METATTQTNITSIIEKQKAFFNTGTTKDVSWRIKQIKKLLNLIAKNEAKICEALKKDLNKAEYESLSVEIGPVFADGSHILKHIREWAEPQEVPTSLFHLPGNSKIYKEPYGNVLLISPWNYPFLLTIAPLIGAMSAGNCVLIKPSEHSVHTSQLMAELINQHFDAGYIHVVQGDAAITQEILQTRWDYIFFTGGTEIGRIIYQAAAKHLTPVTLELGGKSPCVVDKSANVNLAAKRITWGKMINGGQTCIAPDYLFVHEDIKDQMIDALKKHIKHSYGDSPIDHPDYCKIINQRQYDRLKSYLSNGEIIAGGKYDDAQQKIEPTIMLNPPTDSKVMTEEIFGPILPVYTFKNMDEPIKFINEREKPLAAYIFSGSAKAREKFLTSTSSGGASVNDTVLHISSSNMPFGGVGESGMGGYHGKFSFDTFSHHKSVMHRMPHMLDPYLRYAPYSKRKSGIMRFFLKKFL
jgi:aldehyde dehydrogenase (NAD+)